MADEPSFDSEAAVNQPTDAEFERYSDWRPGAASIEDERQRLLRKGRAQHHGALPLMADEPPSVSHEHRWVFVRTDEDWWDGDETDVYRCECGATDNRYIPR